MAAGSFLNALKALGLMLLFGLSIWLYQVWQRPATPVVKASIALLLPDEVLASDDLVAIWIDAAREEGILLDVIHTSEFLRPSTPWKKFPYQGLILPDKVAPKASAALSQGLINFTENGGKLFLSFDAATQNQQGAYYPNRAPLSKLVGVEYALYDQLRDRTIALGNVLGQTEDLLRLGVPPGKFIPYLKATADTSLQQPKVIAGYEYGALSYSSFVTRGAYAGKRLLSSTSGDLVAGYREAGQGGVLFVNLPLGYLKGQTDGLLLHGFLQYFAAEIVGVPSLSAVPNGRGGLIFNWHVDSNAAILPIEKIQQMGLLKQGPFSIHFTAGPDTREEGDGLGLNLSQNKTMQEWVKVFKQRGDALGNHGGWIHDYFGLNITDENESSFLPFLEKNHQSVSAANGSPVREYSAPLGVQPKWVTNWLESQGFVAYYFTGNSGMSATRSYREGRLLNQHIWSFPVLTFGDVASFEEAAKHDISEAEMAEWLLEFSDFTARNATVRMFYSHPPGILLYPKAVKQWFARTQALLDQGSFQWYSMTQIADFLNLRERTIWHIESTPERESLVADHPDNLKTLTWRFPKSNYAKPVLEQGQGSVLEHGDEWYFVAGEGRHITLLLKRKTS
ncbi:hypothetical protein [Undibacterium sp.]|uniref:hypothetical protein n=1 Tax=Undibacterium sp. TaxID=1914977 RepID=UPI0025E64EAE|nr:hypothetical protein [Undibacterium sp.]